jgi:hypothetical protein
MERCQQVEDGNETVTEYHQYVLQGDGVREAGEELCCFIDEHSLLDSDEGPRRPLVVFAFDEADTLTDNPPVQSHWNLFTELRQNLREIQRFPIFSLFLSTAGRFDKFSPALSSELSFRAREPTSRPLDPISEISFDEIAYPALKGTTTMDEVVDIGWFTHLGRPLYVHPSYPFRADFVTSRVDSGLIGTNCHRHMIKSH